MAVVTLNPMFETSSGSLRKPVKRNGHNHGEYLLTTHRVAATTNPNCQRAYTPPKDRYDRVTPLGSNELWARERFGAVCSAVAVFCPSCNVTRTITTESQYYQKGDTSVVIQTKTIETYDASKKLNF